MALTLVRATCGEVRVKMEIKSDDHFLSLFMIYKNIVEAWRRGLTCSLGGRCLLGAGYDSRFGCSFMRMKTWSVSSKSLKSMKDENQSDRATG